VVTVFGDDPALDVDNVNMRIRAWMAARGLAVARVLRVETGVLPMPWRPSADALRTSPPLVAGYRGGWFHPATGYSVPVAVRLALHVAAHADAPATAFGPAFEALVGEQAGQARFAYLLNDLLFHAAAPTARWKVFHHFYALPDDTILRFYGLALTAADKRRMFLRRPPPGVSWVRAMRAFAAWGFR
jgi:lycopene beta-cyclase